MPIYKLYIKEQSGNDLIDYSVKIQLENTGFTDWANLTADSIYFTDVNGNPLYFWIEYLDTTNKRGVIWVKIPSIPKNSTVVINLNYGGSNPYSSYNTPDIFLLFDHFDGTNVDTTKWDVRLYSGGSVTVSDSIITINNALVISKISFSFPVSVRAKAKFTDGNRWKNIYVGQDPSVSIYGTGIETVDTSATTNLYGRDRNNVGVEIAKVLLGPYADNNFHIFEENIIARNNKKFYVDETLKGSLTSDITITSGYTMLETTVPYLYVDYIIVRKLVDPEPAVVGENQLLSLGSVYYDYQETLITGSIYYDGIQTLNLGSIYYDGIEALKLGSIYYDGIVGLNLGSIYYDGITGLGLGSIYYDGIGILSLGSIYYDGIEAVAPPPPPPQILCPEFADILSQEGYSWNKAIASLLCGLEAVLTELGNEISRSAKTISLVFIGIGFGYALMRIGEKIIMLVLKGLRKSYEKKR